MRRFDEYYRCYPVIMMAGPDKSSANFGGKIFLPSSALDKLTRLHIAYPMLFELINGQEDKKTHAGVLEFTAEEGRVYVPNWIMDTLSLEPGDLLQIKSTDLPPGKFIKLEPQSPAFLEISDPRAVLENAFRSFSCLSKNDTFQFHYNDQTFDVKVLEIKPDNAHHSIVTMETDLEVDFAPPVGYVPPERNSGASTPASIMRGTGGQIHSAGSMAQSINYDSIAPQNSSAADGAKITASHFLGAGNRLKAKGKGSAVPSPKPGTPVQGQTTDETIPTRRTNGPQPLRLPEGKLFFGYEIKPLKRKDENGEPIGDDEKKPKFLGEGQTLRGKK